MVTRSICDHILDCDDWIRRMELELTDISENISKEKVKRRCLVEALKAVDPLFSDDYLIIPEVIASPPTQEVSASFIDNLKALPAVTLEEPKPVIAEMVKVEVIDPRFELAHKAFYHLSHDYNIPSFNVSLGDAISFGENLNKIAKRAGCSRQSLEHCFSREGNPPMKFLLMVLASCGWGLSISSKAGSLKSKPFFSTSHQKHLSKISDLVIKRGGFNHLSEKLNIPVNSFYGYLSKRANPYLKSLMVIIKGMGLEMSIAPISDNVDPVYQKEKTKIDFKLARCGIEKERDRNIFRARLGINEPVREVHELAEENSITTNRVCQIEKGCFKLIRRSPSVLKIIEETAKNKKLFYKLMSINRRVY